MIAMLGQRPTLLSPFNQRLNKVFENMLEDAVRVISMNVTTDNGFVHAMRSTNPDFLIAGVEIPRVNKSVINAGKKLKAIICTSMGVDYVDLKAATEKGVFVTNVPDLAPEAVAEYALGLMFALSRKIVYAHQAMTSCNWDRCIEFEGTELCGKTLGVLGMGESGRYLALKAKGLGMGVIAYDPLLTADAACELGIVLVDLDTVLKVSDIVSIHVPMVDYSRKLIGEKQLRAMKKSAFIINCAQGSAVDERALLRALKEKWICGAALDVLEEEPPNSQLLTLDNVVITPHLAMNTRKAKERSLRLVRDEIVRIIKGEIPGNLVNTDLLEQENPYS